MRRYIYLILTLAAFSVACDNAEKADKPKADEPAKEAKVDEKKDAPPAAEGAADEPILKATGPVAKVNGVEITAEDFNKEIGRLKNVASRIPPGALSKFKDSTVTRLVDQKLVETAIDKEKIEVADTEIDEQMEEFKKNMGGPEGVKRFFEKTGMNESEVKSDMRRAVQLEKLLKKKYSIVVDDKAAKDFYEKNIARFTQEAQVKASHILIKVEKDAAPEVVKEKKKAAKDIFKKAKAKDADFAALAKEFSEGPTATRGGDLGFFAAKRMVPAFSEAAFKAKVGQVVGPVKSEFGFHVIKVFEKKEKGVTKFADVKDEIIRNLERKEMREGTQKLIEELRKDAKIDVIAANIKENPKAAPASQPMMMPGMKMPPGGMKMPPGKMKMPPMPKKAGASPKPAAPAPKPATPTPVGK